MSPIAGAILDMKGGLQLSFIIFGVFQGVAAMIAFFVVRDSGLDRDHEGDPSADIACKVDNKISLGSAEETPRAYPSTDFIAGSDAYEAGTVQGSLAVDIAAGSAPQRSTNRP